MIAGPIYTTIVLDRADVLDWVGITIRYEGPAEYFADDITITVA